MNFYWQDLNKDKTVHWSELFWVNRTVGNYQFYNIFDSAGNFGNWWYVGGAAGHFWSGFDPTDPLKKTQQWYVDDDINSPQTWEAMFTLEREIVTDLAVSIGASYRRYTDYEMELWYYPDTGKKLTAADYIEAGKVPATVGGNSTLDGARQALLFDEAGNRLHQFPLLGKPAGLLHGPHGR